MESQLVMLQNEAWGSTICGAMNGFRQTGEFCNVTLLSNDSRSFVAHDCVLAAASPYMKSLLTDMDLPSCMLKLETISGELIEYILQFIYSGMVCLPLTKLANIATASEQLGVDQLKTLCDGFLKDFDGNKQEEGGADLTEKESDSTDTAEGADVVDFTASSKEEGAVCGENETEKFVTVKYEEPDGVDPVHDEVTEREKDVDQPNGEVVEHGKDSKDNVASVQAVTECIPPMQLEIAGTTVDAETVARQILELPPEAKEIIHSNVIVQPSDVVEGDVGEGSREQVIYVQPVNEVDIDGQGATKNDVMEGVAILQQLEDGSSGFIMTGNSGIIHVTLSQQPEGVDDPALQALTINTTVEGMAPTEPNKQSGSTSLLPRTTPMRPFACFRCNKTFTRRGHLTEHERVHTGDVYRCDICSKTFQWKRGLELHTRVHSGEKPYACDFCGKQFAHASNLMVHRKRHSGEKPYACSMCNMTFCSQSSLIRHRKRHSGVKTHKCEHCGKAFFERNVLKRHMRKHTGEKPYMCGVCGDRFTDVTGLSYHRWTHRKDRPLKCPTCNFGCISQSQLTSHMRTHTGERPFKCETCGKGFKIRANLTAHERIHSGERPFECCFCWRKFVTSSQLNKHAVTHVKQEEEDQSSAEQKPYQCSVCGKRFGRRNNMLQHERLHLGLKPFKCSACEWRFTRRTHLMKHQQKMQHGSPDDLLLERERKAKIECTFECNYCTGRFEDENSLMQHQIVCKGDDGEPIVDGSGGMTAMQSNEEGERQFRCNICTRTFKRSTHLKQHKKSHQRIAFFFSPEGRPYECDVCKKRFKRKNTLNQHKMTHRDDQERRHLLCYLCGRGFIRTTHLKTHVRTMHKDVKIPDELKIKSDDDDDEEEGQLEENE